MRIIFADTNYWIALIHSDDQWHPQSEAAEKEARGARMTTTDSVLVELLNYFCSFRPEVRELAAGVVNDILADPNIESVPDSRDLFLSALGLYGDRLDKGYSLTDCISMCVMREREISEVLSHDDHFTQEGFVTLF